MKNTFPVPHKIIESETFLKLSTPAKVLLFTFYKLNNRHAKENGWFYRSTSKLCADTNMIRRTIIRAKYELLQSGLIEIFQTPQTNYRKEATKFRIANYKDTKLKVVTK